MPFPSSTKPDALRKQIKQLTSNLAELQASVAQNDKYLLSVASGSTVNAFTFDVDFGAYDFTASVDLSCTWVTASTYLTVAIIGTTTADHDPEDAMVEGVTAYIVNPQTGSVTVALAAPLGTHGIYQVTITGVN